jgi:hypothetical protein
MVGFNMECIKFALISIIISSLSSFPAFASEPDSTNLNPASSGVSSTPVIPKFQTSAVFVPSSNSGGISGQMYLYNQSCSSGWVKYQLNNGSPNIIIPYNGNYVISYYIEAYNNNGGSVEWNDLQFNVNYMEPGQTNYLVSGGTITPGMSGGGCDSCSQYNIPYYWWVITPSTYFPAGTLIWISGDVTSSGTSCSGNSVLILAGGLGVTQQ